MISPIEYFNLESKNELRLSFIYLLKYVYEHKVDSTNLLFGIVLGAITGGAYFVAAIALAVNSGAFTSAGLDGGNYLPYENSYRNNSANAFIISKASYYD